MVRRQGPPGHPRTGHGSWETMFEDALTGNENDLFDLASQAGARLRESLSPSLSLAPAADVPRFSGLRTNLHCSSTARDARGL